MPFACSESPQILPPIPTPRENRWMTTPDSSWGSVSTMSYTDNRSILWYRREPRFWTQYRVMLCLRSASPESLTRFPIILGSRRPSLFIYLEDDRETLSTLLKSKYPLQPPTPLPRIDRRVQSTTHRSKFPPYPASSPTLLWG